MLMEYKELVRFDINKSFIFRTERTPLTSLQSIINMFQSWYVRL